MKAVFAQADPMRPDIEDGGKGWVLIDDSGPLLVWGVGGAALELHHEARGRQQGLEQGLKTGELELTIRLLQRRCGGLTPSQEARIRALPLPQLEALAEALLDFQAAADLEAWLATS